MFNFDKTFFEENQKRLLFVVNKWYLRWILGVHRLPKELKSRRIDKITPSSIHFDLEKRFNKNGKLEIKTEGAFFTRPRFAEALAYSVTPFVYLYHRKSIKEWSFSPVGFVTSLLLFFAPKAAFFGFAATTTDYYVANGGSGDGVCYEENIETWAQARAAASCNIIYNGSVKEQFIQSWTSGSYHPIRRAFFPADTSGLTSGATISAAILKLYGVDTVANTDSTSMYLVQTTQASTSTLATSDYSLIGTTDGGNKTYASWSTSGYNDVTFNSTGRGWINKTGFTKIGCRDGLDFNDTGPTAGNNSISCYFSRESGTSKDPYYSITYTTSSSYFQTLDETLTLVETQARLTGKTLNEAVVLVDTLAKSIGKTLNEIAVLVDSLSSNYIFIKSLNEALALVDTSTQKVTAKTLVEAVVLVDDVYRSLARSLAEAIVLVDTQAFVHGFTKQLNETLTLVDTLTKQTAKTLAEIIVLVDEIQNSKMYNRSFSETLVLVDAVAKMANKVITNSLTLVDTMTKVGTFGRSLGEVVTLVEYFQGLINGQNIAWYRKYTDQAGTWIKKYLDIP